MPCRALNAYRRTVKWELELSQGSLDCFRVALRSLPVGGIQNALSTNVLPRFHINIYKDSPLPLWCSRSVVHTCYFIWEVAALNDQSLKMYVITLMCLRYHMPAWHIRGRDGSRSHREPNQRGEIALISHSPFLFIKNCLWFTVTLLTEPFACESVLVTSGYNPATSGQIGFDFNLDVMW